MFRLWDCLTFASKECLFLHQRAKHDAHWQPPREESGQDVTVHFSRNPDEAEAERLDREIAPVMRATPGEVKHTWPVEKA